MSLSTQVTISTEQVDLLSVTGRLDDTGLAQLRMQLDALFDTGAMSLRLGIAPHTVEWHVRHVIEKLQVHSKLQAVIAAARKGLIEL